MGAGAAPHCHPTALAGGFVHLLFARWFVLKEETWAGTGAPGWAQGAEGMCGPPTFLGAAGSPWGYWHWQYTPCDLGGVKQ